LKNEKTKNLEKLTKTNFSELCGGGRIVGGFVVLTGQNP
jgi:hypothetical protein